MVRGVWRNLNCPSAVSGVRRPAREGQACAAAFALLGLASTWCGAQASSGLAPVNIVFHPAIQSIEVGETASVGVYLFTDREPVAFSVVQIIFEWDPAAVKLEGLTSVGAIPLLVSNFPANDPAGFNEAVPPQDGDGTYLALAQLGVTTFADPRGTLLTTLQFKGLAPGQVSVVEPIAAVGQTKVVSGVVPGLVITGSLLGCVIEVNCSGVFADLDCDGEVDGADLGLLLAAWGSADESADLDDSGVVDGADLGLLLSAWT